MKDIPDVVTNEQLKTLLEENKRLLTENNVMLHKLRRGAMWATAFRVLWFAIIVGLPIALYYFLLEPNLTTLGRAWQMIQSSVQDVSGWQQFFDQAGS
jgi:hypothetical protein